MRTIKFRAKSKDGRMVYGVPMTTQYDDITATCMIVGLEHSPSTGFVSPPNECFVEVDPETVGEFTGLVDANRKEIFEGDKFKFHDKYKGDITGVIEWSPMASQWWIVWNDGASRYKPLEPDYGDEQLQCQFGEVVEHCYEPGQKTEA